MTQKSTDFFTSIGIGVAAGLIGTGAMMAVRSFDQKYAPKTVPKLRQDPAAFLLHKAQRAGDLPTSIPKPIEKTAAAALHAGYGTLLSVLYSCCRGRRANRSTLVDGIVLGTAAYGVSQIGWFPATGLTEPVSKQEFPEVAGELIRHIVYGVSTAAAFSVINLVV